MTGAIATCRCSPLTGIHHSTQPHQGRDHSDSRCIPIMGLFARTNDSPFAHFLFAGSLLLGGKVAQAVEGRYEFCRFAGHRGRWGWRVLWAPRQRSPERFSESPRGGSPRLMGSTSISTVLLPAVATGVRRCAPGGDLTSCAADSATRLQRPTSQRRCSSG
jgi:hypothetical protein